MKTNRLLRLVYLVIGVVVPTLCSQSKARADKVPRIEEQLSLQMATSSEFEVLRKYIVEAWVFRLPEDHTFKQPPPENADGLSIKLGGKELQKLLNNISVVSTSEAGANVKVLTKDTPVNIGIILWSENKNTTERKGAYCVLSIFVDGRCYLHLYSTRDSVGRYNSLLGEYLVHLLEDNVRQ